MFSLRVRQRSKLWESMRAKRGRYCVTSTELAPMLHASHYGSRRQLWRKKTGQTPRKDHNNPCMEHGNTWEPTAIRKATQFLDNILYKQHTWMSPGTVVDPWSTIICSPDQVCEDFGLEVKCPFRRPMPLHKELIINDNLLQCFACIHVCKFTHWYLFFFDSHTGNSVCYRVDQNHDLWRIIVGLAASYSASLEVGDVVELSRQKGKQDGIIWDRLRASLLEGVHRVL